MKGSFQINKVKDSIQIEGLEKPNYEYSTNFTQYSLRYEDTITINAIYKITSEKEELIQSQIVEHYGQDVSYVNLKDDGLYKIIHIILPTKKWLEDYLEEFKYQTLQTQFDSIYVYDDGIYKIQGIDTKEVSIEELCEINIFNSTVCKSEQLTFNLDQLLHCYYLLGINWLDEICPINECMSLHDKSHYELELIQLEYYVIKFLLEKERYQEAQKLLEDLSGCSGPCKKLSKLTISNNKDCGCNK